MDWPADRGLQVRMVATLALTAAVAAAGAATAYAGVRLLLWVVAGVGGITATAGAAHAASLVVAGGLLLATTVSELWLSRGLGLPEVEARTADREVRPALAGHVDRIAQQLDLPRPTVAITADQAPLAMTTGLTPGSSTLVVSSGLLAALDDDELEAVVAHELAHVRNRDAAVMTLASLPMVVADAVRGWASTAPPADEDGSHYEWETGDPDAVGAGYTVRDAGEQVHGTVSDDDPDDGGVVAPVFVVATGFWFVGRLLVSLLARYRELAADRAAAAATGSPAELASALQTLTEADRPPRRDGRTRHAVDAFAIVPEEPPGPVRLGPEGQRDPTFVNLRMRLNRVFRTHPELDRRLEALQELQADVETTSAH